MQLPSSLITSLQHCKGFDQKVFEAIHASNEQVTSIRINLLKNISPLIPNTQYPIPGSQKIPWSTYGYYLTERPSFTLDPIFHAGAYYVQEASSMFLEEVIKQSVDISQSLKVLDVCAAPGGKSTLLQSVLSPQSILVSNEVIKSRVNILTENITKWGAANVVVTNNDPAHFKKLTGYFDVIVVDAPCSGSGLFRKDPEAIAEWSEQNVQLCSERQQRILADILPALKENGILIYSTCSYSENENEQIADWLVENHSLSPLKIQINEEWNIIETISSKHQAFGYRFYPYKLKGEGFYIASFKKKIIDKSINNIKAKNKVEKLNAVEQKLTKKYLKDPALFSYIKNGHEIFALPYQVYDNLPILQSSLYIKKAGVLLGSVIKDELVPVHELAVSSSIHPDVPFVEINKDTALQYLRREELQINTSQKGWVLVKYQSLSLGWIKILTNRINNYYPTEWRILKK